MAPTSKQEMTRITNDLSQALEEIERLKQADIKQQVDLMALNATIKALGEHQDRYEAINTAILAGQIEKIKRLENHTRELEAEIAKLRNEQTEDSSAEEIDVRIVPCEDCWALGITCENRWPCKECEQSGKFCYRVRCDDWSRGQCGIEGCARVHEGEEVAGVMNRALAEELKAQWQPGY